jgi:hypothetical protein
MQCPYWTRNPVNPLSTAQNFGLKSYSPTRGGKDRFPERKAMDGIPELTFLATSIRGIFPRHALKKREIN